MKKAQTTKQYKTTATPAKAAIVPTNARKAKKKAAAQQQPVSPENSKKDRVIQLMRHPDGVSMETLTSLTGWQKHTVRGFMAGTLKKAGLTVDSFKNSTGERCYRLLG